MSKRRATIARRLVEAQHNAAMLTTFNEVDMTAVMSLRAPPQGSVPEGARRRPRHRLVLREGGDRRAQGVPAINAEIQGDEIVFKHYYDIGMAVGAEGGLVVPGAPRRRSHDLRRHRAGDPRLRQARRNGTLTLEDLKGGTFTITNGGVFGSLMSTPILNPPQVGILGLHKIADRPGGGRPGRDSPDDVSRPQLRPPPRRRARSGAVPRQDQGIHRGSGAYAGRRMS